MGRRVVTILVSIVAILIGGFLIVLSFFYDMNSWQFPLLLGLGSAFLPSGIFAILSDISFTDLLMGSIVLKVEALADRQIKTVDDRVNNLADKLDTSLDVLSKSTIYLSQSKSLGIIMAYPDRRYALEKYLAYLSGYVANKSISNRQLIIVASSIKGVIEKFPDLGKRFTWVIEQAQASGCEVKVLLTHPAYSRYREIQESRQKYDIAKEILHAISWLEGHGLTSNQIKVYKGTPTTFMIATTERMLLNFYPYQTEAFNCFCLEVQDTGDTCIYRSFYDNHFHKPWYGETKERDHYLQTNSLFYIHESLDGPVSNPQKLLSGMAGPFGDFFVIDDEGTFYLAINIRALKRKIVYDCLQDRSQRAINIGDRLDIKLLSLHEGEKSGWEKIGQVEIDPDRRDGYWEDTIKGHTFKALSMLGLFDPENENVFLYDSTNPLLRDKPLPMLYKWLTQPTSLEISPPVG